MPNAKDNFGLLAGGKPFTSGFNSLKKKSLNSQIDALIKARPEFNIANEYGQNQAFAQANAFGRDRSIQQQEANIEQQSANTLGQIGDYSSNTGALLEALRGVTSDKNAALRGLGADESMLQQQKLNTLMGTNTAMAEEKDKAWNYNVNQPYQNQMNRLVQKKKNRQENIWKAIDAALGIATSAAGMPRVPKQSVMTSDFDNY